MSPIRLRDRGTALIAVLWLVAALSAIAFTVASTVRSEVGRVSNATDGLKSYYLATGAIDRALLYMQWQGYKTPDGSPLYYGGGPWMRLEFPGGLAVVNVIPESSKLNVNFEPPEELYNLAMALGAGPERARAIALGIVEYRTPLIETPLSPLSGSSFGPRHASFEEIEELLLVNGMTPELFYGTYESDAQGALVRRHGFVDCLSIYATGVLDVNTVDPAVMAAVGVPPDTVAAILQMRTQWPIGPDRFAALAQGAPGVMRLGIANGSVYTIRATAQGRLPDGTLSDARRSVAAMVKLLDRTEFREPYHVLRWYDNVWVQ